MRKAKKAVAAHRAVNDSQAKKAEAERKAAWPAPGRTVVKLGAESRAARRHPLYR
ncbi:hypothetical protein NKH18_13040 [Streptomyces sp. M10(2022)]